MKCGLLGRKLGHSYSPQIHAHLGMYSYDLFEKEPEEVEDFLKNGDFSAINVTIPYKKTVMPYCHLTERAKHMGSVNTIIRQLDGSTVSATVNTDAETVGDALTELGILEGEEGPYGIYIKSINGVTADYDADGTYWAFYINGEYAMTGADVTAAESGVTYTFAVEAGM